MKSTLKIVTLLVIIGLAGCSFTYKEVYTPLSNVKSENSSGKIVVYEIGEDVDRNHTVIGTLELKDSGSTLRCGYHDGLVLVKQRARELGADAIAIKNIQRPSFASTCDRLTVDIVEFE